MLYPSISTPRHSMNTHSPLLSAHTGQTSCCSVPDQPVPLNQPVPYLLAVTLCAYRSGQLLLNHFSEADLKRVINSGRFQDARSEQNLFRFMDVLLAFHPARSVRVTDGASARTDAAARQHGASRHHSLLRDPQVLPVFCFYAPRVCMCMHVPIMEVNTGTWRRRSSRYVSFVCICTPGPCNTCADVVALRIGCCISDTYEALWFI